MSPSPAHLPTTLPSDDVADAVGNVLSHGYWMGPLFAVIAINIAWSYPFALFRPLVVDLGIEDALKEVAVMWPPHLWILLLGLVAHAAERPSRRATAPSSTDNGLRRWRVGTGLCGWLAGLITAGAHVALAATMSAPTAEPISDTRLSPPPTPALHQPASG